MKFDPADVATAQREDALRAAWIQGYESVQLARLLVFGVGVVAGFVAGALIF